MKYFPPSFYKLTDFFLGWLSGSVAEKETRANLCSYCFLLTQENGSISIARRLDQSTR
jgi:hypothetical protein